MRRSSTAAPRTWRSSPKAFSIVGAPTSSAAIFDTHARIADVFTSTTATSPHCGSTRLFHAQDLLRDAAERAHAVEQAAEALAAGERDELKWRMGLLSEINRSLARP